VRRFVFFSALGASAHDRTRFLRAKALAEDAVVTSDLAQPVVVAPSIVYAPGDVFMTLLSRLALAPVVPVSGRGRAEYQPIWAEDVARCVLALLDTEAPQARYELAGPEVVNYTEITARLLRAAGRPRRLVHVPTPIVARALRATEAILKSKAPATWDEAELMEVSMVTPRGTADAQLLGVEPLPMQAVFSSSCYS
jgi:uncharacterized protein YbjT (DUF2867 family)